MSAKIMKLMKKQIADREETIKKLREYQVLSNKLIFDSGYYCGRLYNKLEKAKELITEHVAHGHGNKTLKMTCYCKWCETLKYLNEEDIPQNNPIKVKDEKETEDQTHKTEDKGDTASKQGHNGQDEV